MMVFVCCLLLVACCLLLVACCLLLVACCLLLVACCLLLVACCLLLVACCLCYFDVFDFLFSLLFCFVLFCLFWGVSDDETTPSQAVTGFQIVQALQKIIKQRDRYKKMVIVFVCLFVMCLCCVCLCVLYVLCV